MFYRMRCLAILLLAVCAATQSLTADTIIKANNGNNLNLSTSWTSNGPPTAADIGRWDSTAATAGINAAGLGADMSWDGIQFVNPGAATWTISGANTLTLGASGIDMAAATKNLTLNSGLSLGATQTWNVASGRTLAVGGSVGGNGKLTKSGLGTLTLTGLNSFSGGLDLGGGTVSINSDAALGHTDGDINVIASSTLIITTAASLAAGRDITLSAGATGTVSTTVSPAILGDISGDGALTKLGAGTLALLGNNTYAGPTLISAGALRADDGVGLSPNSNLQLAGGVFEGQGAATFDRDLGTGAGQVQWLGTGGFSATNGTLTVDLGGAGDTLAWGSTAAFVPGGSVLIFSHANAGASVIFENPIDLNGGVRTVQVDNGAADVDAELSGGLSGVGASLTKTGLGRMQLNGAQNFDGTLWIQNGAIRVDAFSNTTPGTGTIRIGNATTTGELEYTGAANASVSRAIELSGTTGGARLVANGAGTVTLSESFTATGANNKVLALQGSNTGDNTIAGAIVDNSFSFTTSLTKDDAGTWVLAGTNTYTGNTTVNAGTLKLTSGSAISDAGSLIVNGGILDLGGSSESVNAVTLADGLITNGTLTAGTSYAVQGGTVAAVLAGPGVTMTKTGAGATTLTALNTFSGALTINNGKLVVSFLNDTTPGGGPIKLGSAGSSGELEYVGDADTTLTRPIELIATSGDGIITVNGAGSLNLASLISSTASHSANGHGLQLGGSNTGANTVQAAITNHIPTQGTLLIKNGTGRWILTGTNTYTGTTTIQSGTLQVGNGGDSGTLGVGAITVTAPGVLAFDRTGTLTLSNAISGTGAMTVNGAGTIVLAGNATYSGPTTLNAGTLRYGLLNALPSAAAISNVTMQAGATLDLAGFNGTIAALEGDGLVDNTVAAGTNTLTLGINGQTATFNGDIQNTSGILAVTKTGAGTQTLAGGNSFDGSLQVIGGTLVLNGANSYDGQTYISASTLRLDAADQIPNGTGKGDVVLNTTGALLDLNGFSETINGLRNNAGAPIVDIVSAGGSATLTLGDANATASFAGTIRNTTGTLSLTKIGTGTQTLGGANTYSGDTLVSAGKLEFTAASGIPGGAGKGNVHVASGATLEINNTITINGLTGDGLIDNDTATARTLSVGANDQSSTFAGTFTNSGGAISLSLTKVGTGTLILTGANNNGGATTISGGTLQVGDGGTTGTLGTGGTVNNAALVFDREGTLTYGGIISGTGTVTKTSSGTLVLNGASTFTGGLIVSEGVVRGGVVNALPGVLASGNVQLAPGTVLDLGGFNQAVGGLSGTGSVDNTIGGGTYTLSVGINTQSTTFSGAIGNTVGSVALTKVGSGTLTLAGANTYSGLTTITLGTLKLGAADVIPNGPGMGNLSVATANTSFLDLAGFNETVNGLTGAGIITNSTGSATLTIGDADATAVATASLRDGDGVLSLTKIGTGIQTMSGVNSYSGDTVVSNGTLKLGAAAAIPSGPGRGNLHVAAGAAFDISTLATTINGLTGNGVVTNTSTLDTLTIGANDQSSTFPGSIGTLITLIKTGTGRIALAGQNTHSGLTTVLGGTLAVEHAGALGGSTSGTVVTNDAALELAGGLTVTGEALALNGAGITNSGALRSSSGNNTYAGTITLSTDSRIQADADTLTLDVASGNAVNAVARTLTLGGSGNIIVADPMTLTTGGLVKQDSGTATLATTNNYSGGTTINGGTLLVNAPSGQGTGSGPVTVNAGGTLGGAGNITGAVTINSGGNLAAGTSVGTLTVNTLTLEAGSEITVEFNANPANDHTVVSALNGLTVNGGGVYLVQEGTTDPWTVPGAYRLFQYTGTLGGAGVGSLSVLNPQPGMTYGFRTFGGWVEVLVTGELPLISIGTVSVNEGNAGLTALTFPITLTKTGTVAITGTFNTADGTAKAVYNDYQAASGAPFTIPAGTLAGQLVVQVTGDTSYELDETLSVTLTSASNGTILDATAVGTILNDDSFNGAWFVDDTATGNNNGFNWQDAFTDLQSALQLATSGQQIWVAGGTYKPTNGTVRTAHFSLRPGVPVYGGFVGNEVLLSQRYWMNATSILSGDIGTPDSVFDNCGPIVRSALGAGTRLDGFTIRDGYNNGVQDGGFGGAMNIRPGAGATVENCIFENNFANQSGALHVQADSIIRNCIFRFNSDASRGGAVQCYFSNDTFENCVFYSNNGGGRGGAMSLYHQSISLINCTFAGNSAARANSVYLSNGAIVSAVNCIFWDAGDHGGGIWVKSPSANPDESNFAGGMSISFSDVRDGFNPPELGTSDNSINADPLFVSEGGGNLRLTASSPCIDTGTASGAPDDDLSGGARPFGAGFDMGAFEFGASGNAEQPVGLMLILR